MTLAQLGTLRDSGPPSKTRPFLTGSPSSADRSCCRSCCRFCCRSCRRARLLISDFKSELHNLRSFFSAACFSLQGKPHEYPDDSLASGGVSIPSRWVLTNIVAPIAQTHTAPHATSSCVRVNVRDRRPLKGSHSSAAPRSMESYAVIVADASRSELLTP